MRPSRRSSLRSIVVVVTVPALACSSEGAPGGGGAVDSGAGGAGATAGTGHSGAAGGGAAGSSAAGEGGAGGAAGSSAGGASGAAGGASGAGAQGSSAGGTSGGAGGASTLGCTPAWESGFESGFPGEWLDYDNGSWSPSGSMPPGRVSAWTIVDRASGEPVYAGDHAYRGWIAGAATESHRAYPGIQTDVPTPLVNTFWVRLEADYSVMSASEWIHFATWGNDDGMGNGVWALHTMSVRDRHLEFAHTSPFSGEYIGPTPPPDFPRSIWVRFTAYLHYEGSSGFVQVWQDGVPMLRATVSELAQNPGTRLRTAHWGMYASAETTQGVQHNDDLRICTIPSALVDLDAEPDCWLGGG